MGMTLQEIAKKVEGEVLGDGEISISGVATIEEAGPGDITFLVNQKYTKFLHESHASAVIVPSEFTEEIGLSQIRVKNPYFVFLQVIQLFHPPVPLIDKGIHPTAVIGEGSKLGKEVAVGAYVVIGKSCQIGDRTTLLPGVVIGNNVTVGSDCTIHAHVCLRERVVLGNRVIIQNGSVIGSDGFGFAPEAGVYYKIPQVGIVVIEDDVEIGAHTTIDRATLGETRIKKGVKLDNLIQVGHNCTIDENTVIAAQSGLSGSTHIGKQVRIGGQVGFAGHMTIGDGAALGAKSGVSKSIPEGAFWFGSPARPHEIEKRVQAATKRLPGLIKELKELKIKIQQIEQMKRE
jgi:UDP-3-O-[3-hydroxymyristoyl] glucosamine N-acyltransferase